MIERYLFSISNAVNMNLYYACVCALLVVLLLFWLILYQLFGLGSQSRTLKRLCREILDFEGVKGELIDTLNEVRKTNAIVSAWRAFLAAYATARRVSIRDYFTAARILDVPSRRQSGNAFKWLNFVIGLCASVIGAVFIAEKNRFSLYEALNSRLLNLIILLFGFSLGLMLLYLLIENAVYAKAAFRLERFCALSELVFPREKRENYDAVTVKLDQQRKLLDELLSRISEPIEKAEINEPSPAGQASTATTDEYTGIKTDEHKTELEILYESIKTVLPQLENMIKSQNKADTETK